MLKNLIVSKDDFECNIIIIKDVLEKIETLFVKAIRDDYEEEHFDEYKKINNPAASSGVCWFYKEIYCTAGFVTDISIATAN
ncbi:MAG: hypothetical protein Pg6C_14490 [Treponemataceae bacterium]|nr:MAG: hypothetical protein Pg6C_14490 [Treponemataceae bacterium]